MGFRDLRLFSLSEWDNTEFERFRDACGALTGEVGVDLGGSVGSVLEPEKLGSVLEPSKLAKDKRTREIRARYLGFMCLTRVPPVVFRFS